MQSRDDKRGIIVEAKQELELLSPLQSQEEEEFERRERRSRPNGIEETFCTATRKQNVNDPERADFFNPRAGRLTTLNSHNFPMLQQVQLSAQKVHLYRVRGKKEKKTLEYKIDFINN